MKYVATLHMPLPKMKSFMRLGMSVKGMQKTHSIRSLTARDSRNRLVTVRMRRFRTRTVMMRLFPMKLRRKINTYSTILTVWFISDKQKREHEIRIPYFTSFNKQFVCPLNRLLTKLVGSFTHLPTQNACANATKGNKSRPTYKCKYM